MDVKCVSVSGNMFTFMEPDATVRKTLTVADGATITLNGKPAKLTDLKPDDACCMTGEPITSLDAKRPEKAQKDYQHQAQHQQGQQGEQAHQRHQEQPQKAQAPEPKTPASKRSDR